MRRSRNRASTITAIVALAISSALAGGVSDETRREIQRQIDANVERLLADGTIEPATEGSVLFEWPLRQATGFSDPGFYYRSDFVNHAPGAGAVLDYNCGDRTYDVVPIGKHRGTDIVIWPYPWLKMENDQVEIVAAAAGTIVFKQDGFFDKSCDCTNTVWNAIYVRHSDGSTAWYGHMKNGSTTSKGVGASVAAGEFLGRVGSSGCSTVPHLHMEVYDSGNFLIDPFAGPCNNLNASSWWSNQDDYHDSAVNRIVIGATPPVTPIGCGSLEQPNEQSVFNVGDLVVFTTYFRETVIGQTATFRLIAPGGAEHESWVYDFPSSWNSHARQYQRTIDAGAGAWTFRVEYAGEIHERTFFMGETPAGEAVSLMVGKADAGVELTWSDSCGPAVPTAAIHIGIIGNNYTHFGLGCNFQNGSELLPWVTVQGPRYFLVVPLSQNREGSYGRDWTGAERPPGNAACFAQSIGCP